MTTLWRRMILMRIKKKRGQLILHRPQRKRKKMTYNNNQAYHNSQEVPQMNRIPTILMNNRMSQTKKQKKER
ncbi:MAG: hypothetical protein COU32_00450 [Candidatus Magasanikbacteria bacterium CG10_big_fil_rev_8_21_14_0_10_42_10]|uniref:Uncharacterized protein n=2 Tax=Candidatus Magasanikiibacteriota TaxID=1752731 RepID=A0A2H0TX45_9BACT|nr:MAG: hypothetical protein COU32_00450 [Candidatus Magasanikbacteria bacterium CG10_big_fil_rev_8_21_14_0_10_42_10]PIZ94135.1 MAG: hypothetical protein COX82_01325 [Candidatus Magasanikbacteria bacterium CG_4_10_14_0_2_um_filter_41_10]